MISKTEKSVLWLAIRSESRPILSQRHKNFLWFGLMVTTAGIGSLYLDIGHLSRYLLMIGIVLLFFAILALPKPWRFNDEMFRRKPLRVSTIEKLKSSVGKDVLSEFVQMQGSDDEKCLRVHHIFAVLDKESRFAETACVKNIGNEQKKALEI